MWRKGNLYTLLLEMSVASATMVNSMEISQKIKTRTTIVVVAAVHLLSHIQLYDPMD